MKLTEKNWAEFLKWLKKEYNLSVIYTPNKYSIKLWKECESAKRRRK